MSVTSGIGKKSRGGTRVPHHKNTMADESLVMPAPQQVTLLMSQHIGKPAEPVVAVGDKVMVGQMVGESSAFISARVHASISGTVSEIKEVLMPSGDWSKAVVIKREEGIDEGDFLSQPVQAADHQQFIEAVKNCGLVGLGGAGFPTHIKLNPADLDSIDALIINGAECEPYITSDYREMLENSEAVAEGIRMLKKKLFVENIYIGIEANKPKAIALMTEIFQEDEGIRVITLRARYPQGAEKVLVYECLGRVVPEGKLPADVGCIVMNVTTVSTLYRYMTTGMPLTVKRVTVDGGAVNSPANVIAPIGTSIKDIVEFAGGYRSEPRKLIMGGPMMGTAVVDGDFPILKSTNAVLALTGLQCSWGSRQTPCIRCGKCIDACPLNLMPASYERAQIMADVDQLRDLKVNLCMECGTCSFVCPAKRDLVHSIRQGKVLLHKGPKAKK